MFNFIQKTWFVISFACWQFIYVYNVYSLYPLPTFLITSLYFSTSPKPSCSLLFNIPGWIRAACWSVEWMCWLDFVQVLGSCNDLMTAVAMPYPEDSIPYPSSSFSRPFIPPTPSPPMCFEPWGVWSRCLFSAEPQHSLSLVTSHWMTYCPPQSDDSLAKEECSTNL